MDTWITVRSLQIRWALLKVDTWIMDRALQIRSALLKVDTWIVDRALQTRHYYHYYFGHMDGTGLAKGGSMDSGSLNASSFLPFLHCRSS